ncbi:hypothetical protein [Delftia tsuruhatensis]|uniref:hypothetical protein n=1 Tax=Delftia tsuruhatensis TaxID=180282 RepID=UPI001F45BD0A|nr:hypothetical protein [Delftia tsuruhatensis]
MAIDFVILIGKIIFQGIDAWHGILYGQPRQQELPAMQAPSAALSDSKKVWKFSFA